MSKTYKITEADSYSIDIFVAGSLDHAAAICVECCMEVGLCVTVTPTEYVYTGGRERGVRVGLINYPRFPADRDHIMDRARALAVKLIEGLFQHSATIQALDRTIWITRRPADLSKGE